MNVRHARSSAPAPWSESDFNGASLLSTVAGIAPLIALLVVAGLGLWRTDRSEPVGPGSTTAVEGSDARALAIERHRPERENITWLYIVGSKEEAESLKTAAASVPGNPSDVIVVGSRGEADFADDLYRGLNALGRETGLPQVKVVVVSSFPATE